MRKIFIAGSFRKKEHRVILEGIEETLRELGYKTFIGARDIDNYTKIQMPRLLFWKKVVKGIEDSDAIIIDLRDIGTGFGRVIEAGVARAFNKKMILLYPPKFKTDQCIEEIADKIISYKNLKDLQQKLKKGIKFLK